MVSSSTPHNPTFAHLPKPKNLPEHADQLVAQATKSPNPNPQLAALLAVQAKNKPICEDALRGILADL